MASCSCVSYCKYKLYLWVSSEDQRTCTCIRQLRISLIYHSLEAWFSKICRFTLEKKGVTTGCQSRQCNAKTLLAQILMLADDSPTKTTYWQEIKITFSLSLHFVVERCFLLFLYSIAIGLALLHLQLAWPATT